MTIRKIVKAGNPALCRGEIQAKMPELEGIGQGCAAFGFAITGRMGGVFLTQNKNQVWP
ncbi:MAG: hypothetical protein U5L46_07245 [Agrobacterium sp.]|nr:hypothetical protein [Agrobacterium sp.]